MELKGHEFDWEGFNKACAERWQPVGLGEITWHCTKHNTEFQPHGDNTIEWFGQDAEPCWQCYNEFNKEIK